jgi:hypothetical protein
VWHVKEPSLLKAVSAKHRSKFAALSLVSCQIVSDVPIVSNIRLAIVGNATMLLIDSAFHNQKSLMSAKNNLVRVNSTQTHPKCQANSWIVIKNFRMHKKPSMHLFYEEYGLKSQGSSSSNSVWHVTIHNAQNGKRMLGICQCPEENYIYLK